MTRIEKRPLVYRKRRRFPSLRRYGLAVEYFPRYVNRECLQHAVDVVLLSVVVRGRGWHVLGDEIHEEAGGSVAVVHYGQKHDIVTDRRGMDIYNVYLDLRHHALPVLPESLRSTLSAILPVHPRLQHHLNRRVWIRMDDPERLAASLARIEREMKSRAPGALEIVQHSFQIFLIDVCRAAQANGLVTRGRAHPVFPPWVEKVRRRLEEHFQEPQALASLAREAGVSAAYLCRFFRAYTGRTLFEYLVERRIHAAIWKLRESDEKVISVALGSGFNSLAYFNRTFKRLVGATPSAYRRQIKKPAA